jgi:hypothetical protein
MFWISKDIFITIVFSKINLISLIFIPTILLHLIFYFIKSKFLKYINLQYYISTIIAVIGVFTNLFYNGVNLCFWGFYPSAGNLYFILVFYIVLLLFLGIYLLYKNLMKTDLSLIQKEQTKYFISSVFLLMFLFFDFISVFGEINIYPLGYISVF